MSKKTTSDKKLFYSGDGTTIRVTHPDGAVALVGAEPRELPQKLWREATKQGCLYKGGITADQLKGPEPNQSSDAFKRNDMILGAMYEAAKAPEDAAGFEDAFTAAGVPNVRWLEKRLGFSITGDERDTLWAIVAKKLDDEEADAEDDEDEGAQEDEGEDEQES